MNACQGGGKVGRWACKSKAKMLDRKHAGRTFDAGGHRRGKRRAGRDVGIPAQPAKNLSRLGGKIPKGALLEGPPVPVKPLLARAIAGEAGGAVSHHLWF